MARDWDLTTTSAIQAAAAWMCKKSGALLVVIVRVDDLAISANPKLAPRDSTSLLEDRMPELHERLQVERLELREKLKRQAERLEKRGTR